MATQKHTLIGSNVRLQKFWCLQIQRIGPATLKMFTYLLLLSDPNPHPLLCNQVGGGVSPPSSYTTVRTDPYTAVR